MYNKIQRIVCWKCLLRWYIERNPPMTLGATSMDFHPGIWLAHFSMFDFVSLLVHWIGSDMSKWFVIQFMLVHAAPLIPDLQIHSFNHLFRFQKNYDNKYACMKTEPESRHHFFYWFCFCPLVKVVNENKEVAKSLSVNSIGLQLFASLDLSNFASLDLSTFHPQKLCLCCAGIGRFQFWISYM